VRVFVNARARLGEGPRWDPETDELLWVDISAGTVHLSTSDGDRVLGLDRTVTAVARIDSDRLIAVLADAVAVLDRRLGTLTELEQVEQAPGVRLNDAACDSRGRLWMGSMSADGGDRSAGRLYRVERGVIAPILDGVGLSNGIGWSPDASRMYYVDSTTQRIDVLDYEPSSGEISNRRPFVEIDPAYGIPDGLCVDSQGGVWVALFGGGAVRRFTPEGELHQVIDVPADNVTACAFGGPGGKELFITTAAERVAPARARLQPHAGAVFAVDTGWSGPPAPAYLPS
jgi:sugar lactone lactonase YvrE